jgi:hypothetical protein
MVNIKFSTFIPKRVCGPITSYAFTSCCALEDSFTNCNTIPAPKSGSHLALFYVPLTRRGIFCTQQAYANYADGINEYELRKYVFAASAVTNMVFH